MKGFVWGLLTAFVGFLVLAFCCDLFGSAAVSMGAPRQWGGYVGNALGFLLLIGGPLFFWMICPIWHRRRNA